MAKRRLSNDRRMRIKSFICDKVRQTTMKPMIDATKKSHDRWIANLVGVVESNFPQLEMKVLDKYGCATKYGYVTITVDHGPDKSHEVMARAACPDNMLMPDNNKTAIINVTSDSELRKSWLEYDTRRQIQKEKEREILADYAAVIGSAITFEELVEVIPEIEPLGATLWNCGTSVMNISDEILARVSADQKARAT